MAPKLTGSSIRHYGYSFPLIVAANLKVNINVSMHLGITAESDF